jgi:hypothetical protein
MADIVTSTTIADGGRQAVMSFTYQYVDGGNESAVTKVDVSALSTSSDGTTCTGVRIAEVWWTTVGMSVLVESDASTDICLMQLAEGGSGYLDYTDIGGITSSLGSSPTGDILFTTTGAGAVGDTYNVVFRMIKEY